MNLQGVPNYQREVGIMRNPSSNFDVLNKLIFIYPFGIDQSIVNLPFSTYTKGDADTLGDAMRSFFSISVLKEIFTSNALNLIKTASTYERTKIVQDKSSALINSLLRGNVGGGFGGGYYSDSSRTEVSNNIDSGEIQSKVNQKVDVIKQMLHFDPRMKKLLPFMEVITLQNMLDVPVITGTAPFQLDTTSLFAFLSTAIVTRTKMDEWGGVRKLFNKLHSMPDMTVNQMIDVLTQAGSMNQAPLSSDLDPYSSKLIELNIQLNKATNPAVKERIQQEIEDLKDRHSSNYIANLKDDKMKELERNMMMMIDLGKLSLRYGLSNSHSDASYTMRKITPQTNLLFDRTRQQFVDSLIGLDAIFSSFYMIFSPIKATDPAWGTNYQDLRNEFINYIVDQFDKYMATFKGEFSTVISKNIEGSSSTISMMNKSCENAREDFIAIMNLINREMNGKQIYPSFSRDELENFSNAIDKIVVISTSVLKNTKKSLSQFLGEDAFNRIFNTIETMISDSFDIYSKKYNLTNDPLSKMQARLFVVAKPDQGQRLEEFQYEIQRMHATLLNSVNNAVRIICQTLFLMIFKLNLCDFVEVADVEFGIAKNDVLDLPNYCLAIPIEIAQALFVIYTTKNWKNAVARGGSGGFNPLNMSYLKGIVKLLRLQLGIPNLLVYDRKKNELYYSLQYMGSNVEKIKMQALGIFIKHHLQDKSSGVSQVYY